MGSEIDLVGKNAEVTVPVAHMEDFLEVVLKAVSIVWLFNQGVVLVMEIFGYWTTWAMGIQKFKVHDAEVNISHLALLSPAIIIFMLSSPLAKLMTKRMKNEAVSFNMGMSRTQLLEVVFKGIGLYLLIWDLSDIPHLLISAGQLLHLISEYAQNIEPDYRMQMIAGLMASIIRLVCAVGLLWYSDERMRNVKDAIKRKLAPPRHPEV